MWVWLHFVNKFFLFFVFLMEMSAKFTSSLKRKEKKIVKKIHIKKHVVVRSTIYTKCISTCEEMINERIYLIYGHTGIITFLTLGNNSSIRIVLWYSTTLYLFMSYIYIYDKRSTWFLKSRDISVLIDLFCLCIYPLLFYPFCFHPKEKTKEKTKEKKGNKP